MLNLLRSMSTQNQKGNLFQFLSLRIASEAAPGAKHLPTTKSSLYLQSSANVLQQRKPRLLWWYPVPCLGMNKMRTSWVYPAVKNAKEWVKELRSQRRGLLLAKFAQFKHLEITLLVIWLLTVINSLETKWIWETW